VVERLRNQLARTLSNLAGPLHGPNPNILSPDSNSFANILRRACGMQRNQIPGTLTNAFGRLPDTLTSTLANIPRAAPYIAAGTTAFLRRRLR